MDRTMLPNDSKLSPVDVVREAKQAEYRRRLLVRFIEIAHALGLSKKEVESMVRMIVRKHF
jgi:hypothetical protein